MLYEPHNLNNYHDENDDDKALSNFFEISYKNFLPPFNHVNGYFPSQIKHLRFHCVSVQAYIYASMFMWVWESRGLISAYLSPCGSMSCQELRLRKEIMHCRAHHSFETQGWEKRSCIVILIVAPRPMPEKRDHASLHHVLSVSRPHCAKVGMGTIKQQAECK